MYAGPSNRSHVAISPTALRCSLVICRVGLSRANTAATAQKSGIANSFYLRFLRHRHRAEIAAIPVAAYGQQDVPHQWVHRGATDHPDAAKVLIGGRHVSEIQTHHKDDGRTT